MKNLPTSFLFIFFFISTYSFSQTSKIDYTKKGIQKIENEQFSEAIIDFKIALKLNPKDTLALHKRALCYEATEKYDLALNDFLQLNKSNQNEEIVSEIGFIYLNLENYPKAKEYLNSAIVLNPKNPNYLYNLGYTYFKEKDHLTAIKYYDKAIEIDNNRLSFQKAKARSLYKMEKYEDALAIINPFFNAKKFDIGFLAIRLDIYKHQEKYDLALKDAKTLLVYNPNDIDLLLSAGESLLYLEEYEEELLVRKKILEIAETDKLSNNFKAAALTDLGISYSSNLDYENALSYLNKAINLNNKEPYYFFRRCIIHAYLKNYESACKDYKTAVNLSPEKEEDYDRLIRGDEALNDFVEYCLPTPEDE